MRTFFLLQARLRPEAQDVGPRQGRASDRRRLFPDVRQPGLHRDRLLCSHLKRASQGLRNSPHEPLEGADGLSFSSHHRIVCPLERRRSFFVQCTLNKNQEWLP